MNSKKSNVGGHFNSKLKKTGFLADVKKNSRLISKDPIKFLEDYANNKITNTPSNNANMRNNYHHGLETNTEQLESFIQDLQTKPSFLTFEKDMRKKQEVMKRRSCILKMATSNIVQVDQNDIDYLSRTGTGSSSAVNKKSSRSNSSKNQQKHIGIGTQNDAAVADDDNDHDSDRSSQSDDSDNDSVDDDAEILEKMIESYIQQIKTKILNMESIFEWIVSETKMTDMKLPYGLPKNLKIPSNPEMLINNNNLASNSSSSITTNQYLYNFIESSIDNFLLLDGEYHNKIEQITNEIAGINLQLLQEKDPNSNESSSSSWNLVETALLTYIITTLAADDSSKSSCPLSGSSSIIHNNNLIQAELCQRLFPTKSQISIINQKYRLKTKKLLEEKRASVLNDWIHDKVELESKINSSWKSLNTKLFEATEQQLSIKKQLETCLYWSACVDELRKQKCEKIKKLRLLIEPLREKHEKELQLQAQLEARRRQGIQRSVAQYKVCKDQFMEQKAKEKEAKIQFANEIKKMNEKINKTRVNYRRVEWSEKEKARKEAEKVKQNEILLRAAKLESIKKPVHIEYEPWNVINDTYASAVRRLETLQAAQDSKSNEQAMIKFFRDSYSFSTENLLKDRRLRLEIKLRESGLMESSYARQVLAAMQPKEKPHLKTQIKFESSQE